MNWEDIGELMAGLAVHLKRDWTRGCQESLALLLRPSLSASSGICL